MSWTELDFQPQPQEILRRALANGRVAHAYLFGGPAGTGKLLAARLFAQTLNCEAPEGERPCLACRTCDRLRRSLDPDQSLHPDLIHLAPGRWVGADGRQQASQTILIDAVRDLRQKLFSAPLEARTRVVLIHEADTMQVPAQNAFLKTLEEPAVKLRTLFLLLATRPRHLLPTIRSRCQTVLFPRLDERRLAAHLERVHHVPEERARLWAALSEGSLLRAAAWVKGEEEESAFLARRDAWLDLWRQAVEKPHEFDPLAEAVGAGREAFKEFLDVMILWTRDLIRLAQTGDPRGAVNFDRTEHLIWETERTPLPRLMERYDRLLRFKEGTDLNLRATLAVKGLLARMTVESAPRRA